MAKKTAADKPSSCPPPKTISPFRAWADNPSGLAMNELCQHIVVGGHLAGFCASYGFAYVTMLDWINADPKRAEMYARAREDRADVLADEIIAIADEVEVRTKIDGEDVILAMDPVAVQRNKLRVDARKWAASKLKPRLYGDKVALTDPDGGVLKIEQIRRTIVDPKEKS